jgi:oxygen-independent coproporphyrinogen-3 oxidase
MEESSGDYVEALLSEISAAKPTGTMLRSVYIGGGTPTVLPSESLVGILSALATRFGLSDDAEVTVEANPGTVSLDSLANLRDGGFNRLSIGVQSLDDDTLARLGRIHTAEEARAAVMLGREAGFDNIGIDLMYALPNQSVDEWRITLENAVELSPEHISLYELTVEEGTVFGNLRGKCQLQLPDEDTQIEMYLTAMCTLKAAGYEHYEISNFALPGRRSRHNQVYWRNEPYFGFGAGASGYISGARYINVADPSDYIAHIKAGKRAVATSEAITGRQSMGETVMLGLRMIDGLDLDVFRTRYGVELVDVYRSELDAFIARGLIELTSTHLRLTSAGLLVANDVMVEFL